jgi:hypothetical protein
MLTAVASQPRMYFAELWNRRRKRRELEALAEGRVIYGDPATVEAELLED